MTKKITSNKNALIGYELENPCDIYLPNHPDLEGVTHSHTPPPAAHHQPSLGRGCAKPIEQPQPHPAAIDPAGWSPMPMGRGEAIGKRGGAVALRPNQGHQPPSPIRFPGPLSTKAARAQRRSLPSGGAGSRTRTAGLARDP